MIDLLDQNLPPQGHPVDDTVKEALSTGASSFVGGFPEYIDSSMLSSFKACEELFRKTYVEHWKPKDSSVHLHAGGAFAKGLEVARRAFFTGEFIEPDYTWLEVPDAPPVKRLGWKSSQQANSIDSETSIALGLQALLAAYGDFDCPEDSAKSASRMAGAFEYYFDNYPLRS